MWFINSVLAMSIDKEGENILLIENIILQIKRVNRVKEFI